MKRRNHAIAIITALSLGAVLAVFGSAFFFLLADGYQASRRQQRMIQAEWNARSGYEHYLVDGTLPDKCSATGFPLLKLSSDSNQESCVMQTESGTGNIIFIGKSGLVERRLILVNGRPDMLVLDL